jgi:hypothetical protein
MKEIVHRSVSVPFRRFLGDLRREFMQGLSVVLHGTLGSYLRDGLHVGGANVVACLSTPFDFRACYLFFFADKFYYFFCN